MPTRKRKLGDLYPIHRLPDAHNPDLDEKQVSLTGRLTETKNEHFRRAIVNAMIKMQLQRGIMVQYVSAGHSLHPLVHCGDSCLLEPVMDPSLLMIGDIVFCEVQPGN